MDICGSHFLLWLRQAVIVGQVPFIGDNKRCATRKGGNNTSCNLFGGRPAVQVLGSMRRLPIFQHGYLFIITFQYFHDECQEPLILHTFFIDSKLNVLMKIVDMIEKLSQLCTFTNRINIINKLFPNFLRVYCRRYWSLFMSLHRNI